MSGQQIRFNDGAVYERSMGIWSRLAGDVFLDWLAPPPGLRWIDVGCGNGAFTELLMQRCAPAEVVGIDPSPGQLAFARGRPGAAGATFLEGDAMALPFEAARFDAAVMALVIFFVPDPARGVAELARVLRPGGEAAAYAWDVAAGGFPFEPVRAEFRAMGLVPPSPPQVEVARIDRLAEVWAAAGFEAVETREIRVQNRFADFDAFWANMAGAASVQDTLASVPPAEVMGLRERLAARLPRDASGAIVCGALANAVRGRRPG
jgi:SAM-dependent methyltransferase